MFEVPAMSVLSCVVSELTFAPEVDPHPEIEMAAETSLIIGPWTRGFPANSKATDLYMIKLALV